MSRNPATNLRTTIRDVAERAGVSPASVSNLLNGKGRIGEATRARIRAAMDELHFTPNGLIRALQSRRNHILGLIIAGLGAEEMERHSHDSITLPLLFGIYEAADDAAQDVLLYTGWPHRPERSTGRDFLDGRVDGLLWLSPSIGSPALEHLADAGLPVVTLLTRRVPDTVAYVDSANVEGARVLVDHLLAQGHRRIAYVGPLHNSNFLDRHEGYRRALEAAGLPVDPALVAADMALRTEPEAYRRALDSFLALPAPPTAVFVCNDRWAVWMAEAAAARGLSIPGDLALAGFDDVPAARTLCGGLTTVRQSFPEIGRQAVEKLLARIDGAPVAECRVTVPISLTVRASTARPV